MGGNKIDKTGTLTRAGQRLLAVFLDPQYADTTDVEKAKAAGVSIRHFHRLTHDPHFQAALKAKALELITPKIRPVLDAAIKTAVEPGRDGFKDREMLLRMIGWYDPKSTIEHQGSDGGPIQIVVGGLNPAIYGTGEDGGES